MSNIESILDKCTSRFLAQIRRTSDMSYSHQFSNKNGGFPLFFDNRAYNEQTFFEERIENLTWRFLVNDVLKELFSEEYCAERKAKCEWISMHPQITFSYVEKTESVYSLEFIITFKGKRIGYRYTNCYWFEEKMDQVIRDYNLDELHVIDFSGPEINAFMHPLHVSKKYSAIVMAETLEAFFIEYFTKDEYELYIKNAREAVEEAYRYVGLQTIPNMTLQYMAYLIKKELKEIGDSSLGQKEYKVINVEKLEENLKKHVNNKYNYISDNDYQIMNEHFYNQGRYHAMCGSETFAHSFLTSEYLYRTMQTNNHFDYTAVVAGYLKSIEQLLYRTVLLTLNSGTKHELWIKYKKVKNDDNEIEPETRKDPSTKQKQVKFIPENEKFFDTTFTPMVHLLHSNADSWMVSNKARNRILTCLKVFCAECRNEHFHKENIYIEDIEEVETIRHNTMLLFYYILGAYVYTGNVEKDKEVLGIPNRRYDDMYQAITAQSAGGDYFLLQFAADQPILCALPMNHGEPKYNENGQMSTTKIRFVKIERKIDEDWHKDDWHIIENDLKSSSNIYLTPENMPNKIEYIEKVSGKRIEIKW